MEDTSMSLRDEKFVNNSSVEITGPSCKSDIPSWLFPLLMGYVSYATVIVAIFGIPGNILVIVTYFRIGFAESINISYCALGVSDILCVSFIAWNAICFIPAFAKSGIPVVARDVVIFTGVSTSIKFIDITAWITAFISLERCLCVVFPLKIKNIVTHNRTVRVIVAIFTLTAIPLTANSYYLHVFEFRFDAQWNRTVLGVGYRNASAVVFMQKFNRIYKLVVLNLLPYTTILICSVFLAVYLNRSVSWRLNNSGSTAQKTDDSKTNRKNAKEIRVAKTVLSLATAFLFLGTLSTMRLLVSLVWPEFGPLGACGKTFKFIGRVGFLLSLSNSSVNFFIYYTMGTKFKQTVNEMLHCNTKQGKENNRQPSTLKAK